MIYEYKDKDLARKNDKIICPACNGVGECNEFNPCSLCHSGYLTIEDIESAPIEIEE